MSRRFRSRVGPNGDVIYEIQSLLWCWLPETLDWGWKPFANTASERNKLSTKLNEQCAKILETVDKLAAAESVMADERADLKSNGYNHLGVGRVIHRNKKDFKHMLPHVGEPKAEWKVIINIAVVQRAFKRYKVDFKKGDKEKAKKRQVFTTEAGARNSSEPLMTLPHLEKQNSSGDKGQNKQGNKSKGNWKQLRSELPRERDTDGEWVETTNEWDDRVRGEFNDRKND